MFDLHQESVGFAQGIESTLDAILPVDPEGGAEHRSVNVFEQGPWRIVRPGTAKKLGAINLLSRGEHVANFWFSFKCGPDQAQRYLAVRKSVFQLQCLDEGLPLLRLDFNHKAYRAPVAHWNVHADREAMSVLLKRCNPRHVGLVSQVHLPVGGTRYRPCLEDFLDMLITEFCFDTNYGWRDAVLAGRERWRIMQARSIVRDFPDIAAEVLENELGYRVRPPEWGHEERNGDTLRAR